MWVRDDGAKAVAVKVNEAVVMSADLQPFVRDGRTLVPARFISEALGAEVGWCGVEQKVTITKDNTEIILTIGSAVYTVNGSQRTLDVPAQLREGRTVVPLRLIAEIFGCEVEWDPGPRNRIDWIRITT